VSERLLTALDERERGLRFVEIDPRQRRARGANGAPRNVASKIGEVARRIERLRRDPSSGERLSSRLD